MKKAKKRKRDSNNEMKGQEKIAMTSESPSWSLLPALAISAICKNLCDEDKVSMAMVCKTWHQGLNDPSLWRARTFQFNESRKDIGYDMLYMLNERPLVVVGGKRAILFARSFSRHLKKLEIHIFQPCDSSSESASDLKTFSELFDDSELKKIYLRFFQNSSSKYYHNLNAALLQAFIRLFQNQYSLEEFLINSVGFTLTQWVQILNSLAQTSGETLQKLNFERCFLVGHLETIHNTGPVINEIKKFSNLTEFELKSAYLSDDLLYEWSRKCPNFKLITIRVQPQNYVVTSEAWQALINTHPELTVEMYVLEDDNESNFSLRVLSPVLPLSSLVWNMGLCFAAESEFTSFLHRLANYHKTLGRLYVRFISKFGDPDHAAVMNVLSKLSKLPPLSFKKLGRSHKIWIIKVEKKY